MRVPIKVETSHNIGSSAFAPWLKLPNIFLGASEAMSFTLGYRDGKEPLPERGLGAVLQGRMVWEYVWAFAAMGKLKMTYHRRAQHD